MELLKQLTKTNSASGREDDIKELILEKTKGYYDEKTEDALKNLILRKKGTNKKIMIAAHMDEIGVIITVIDEDGFLRFSQVGGLYNEDLVGRRVIFKNSVVGVIGADEENKERKINKLYIDIGAKNKEDAKRMVSVGDTGVFVGDFYENDDIIISKALDNRVGCYIMIEAMKRVKSENDLYFVFTTQEEVGLRGARTSAFSIEPDYAVCIDVTDAGDTPEKFKIDTKLGDGAAIKIMDASVMCDPFIRSQLSLIASKNNIPYQLEVMTAGGTDAGAIAVSGAGVKTGGISVPARYIHSPSEMVSKKDIKACIDLLTEFLNQTL